jgi:phage RecT family recombinase
MTQEIAKRYDQVIDMAAERFTRNAPKHIRFENEKGYAIQLLQNNSHLMQVAQENPHSLLQAITNIAAIGLSLNPAKRQAYLITRSVKQDNKYISKVFLEPSYSGLCDLATMSGSIEWVQANCVYEKDLFVDNGPGNRPAHTYPAFSKDRGAFAGVCCVAKVKSGDYLTTIMTAAEVNAVRDRSEAYKAFKERNKGNGGPWVTDYEEMAKKAVVRRAFKMWPKTSTSEALDNAVLISNENEGFEPILSSPPLGQYTGAQKESFDKLISQSNAIEMFVFTKTLDDDVFTNLYHSFEKGTKGKYQTIIKNLIAEGSAKVKEYTETIEVAAIEGHDLAALELVEGLTDSVIEFIQGQLSHEASRFLRDAIKQSQPE